MNKKLRNIVIASPLIMGSMSGYAIDMSTWLGGGQKQKSVQGAESQNNVERSEPNTNLTKPSQGVTKPAVQQPQLPSKANIPNTAQSGKTAQNLPTRPNPSINISTQPNNVSTPVNEAPANSMGSIKSAVNSDDSLYEAAARNSSMVMPKIQNLVQNLSSKQKGVVLSYSGLLLGISLGSSSMDNEQLSQMVQVYNAKVSCGTALGLAPVMNQARTMILSNPATGTLYNRNINKFGNSMYRLGTNGNASKCS